MKSLEMTVEVGHADVYDDNRVDIKGTLIRPENKSRVLVLFACGVIGHRLDYEVYFGKMLGNEFNVYITQLRDGGWTSGENLMRDHFQIDTSIREIVEPEKVVYVGHSMGMNVSVASKNKYGTEVNCFYGICAYPSFGDSRTDDDDLSKISLQQKFVSFAEKLDIGPLGLALKDQTIHEPVRFAIGGIDEVVNTRRPNVCKRFKQYFERFENSSVEVFQGRNHCFNYKPKDFAPFNKDDPKVLVDDVTRFIYDNI